MSECQHSINLNLNSNISFMKKLSILITLLPLFSFAQSNYSPDSAAGLKAYTLKNTHSSDTEKSGLYIPGFKTSAFNIGKQGSISSDADYTEVYKTMPDAMFVKTLNFKATNTHQIESSRDTGENSTGHTARLFVGAGVSFNTITLSGITPLYNSNGSHSSIGAKFSAGINLYPVPAVGKSVIRLEATYTSASFSTSGNLYFSEPAIKANYSLGLHIISIIPQFQVNLYNSNALKFYVDAGVGFNFAQYSDNAIYDSVTKLTYSNYFGTNKHWFSVPVKAGVILNRNIEISLDYIYAQKISNNSTGDALNYDYTLKISNVQAALSYLF